MIETVANSLMFATFLSYSLGWFDDVLGGDGDLAAPVDDAATPQYSQRVDGTGDDDTIVAEGNSIEFFLFGGDDDLTATDGSDYADGGDGDDRLSLRSGNDIAFGGAGNDLIAGGFGDDVLHGDAGDDRLDGNSGSDTLNGGAGNDVLSGQSGEESQSDNPAKFDGIDQLSGEDGDDRLILGNSDIGTGGAGADTFNLDDAITDGNFAIITDFNASEDVLELEYRVRLDPLTDAQVAPVISSTMTEDGTGTMVTLDGEAVAYLRDVMTFDPELIVLSPQAPV